MLSDSNNVNKQYDIEIEKLKALNKLCLDIWSRIEHNKQDDHFTTHSLIQIIFENRQLTLTYKTVPFEDLSLFFANIPNFFNDKLPAEEYFDLSSVINKYAFLCSKRSLPLLSKWKMALECVQVYLGKVETQIMENTQFLSWVYNIFEIKADGLAGRLLFNQRNHHYLDVDLKMKCMCDNEECQIEVEKMAKVVMELYEIGNIQEIQEVDTKKAKQQPTYIIPSERIPMNSIAVRSHSGCYDQSHTPECTLKEDRSCFISSKGAASAWIVYDLQDPTSVNRISIENYSGSNGCGLKNIELETSCHANGPWTLVTRGNCEKETTFSGFLGTGRYWRLSMIDGGHCQDCRHCFYYIKFYEL